MSLSNLVTVQSDLAQLILQNSGGGHELANLCKLRACNKSFRNHEYMSTMYAQQQVLYRRFFSDSSAAYDAVCRGDSLESSFETMKMYMDMPFFFDAMQAMLKTSAKAYFSAPDAVKRCILQTRLLLENYQWEQFCQHVQVYHRFHDIVAGFLDYILDIVMDVRNDFSPCMYTNSIQHQAYENQTRRILAKLGNAGVVQCLWTVCAHHSTREYVQTKLLHVLCELIPSSSVYCVRDILKNPGSMRVFEDIVMNMEAGPPRSPKSLASNVFLNNYAQLVHAMFLPDPVFGVDEKIRVVGAVHAVLEKCLALDCISKYALRLLLESIDTRTRDTLTDE